MILDLMSKKQKAKEEKKEKVNKNLDKIAHNRV